MSLRWYSSKGPVLDPEARAEALRIHDEVIAKRIQEMSEEKAKEPYAPYYDLAAKGDVHDINSEAFKILRAAAYAARDPKVYAEEVRAGQHIEEVYHDVADWHDPSDL